MIILCVCQTSTPAHHLYTY